MVVLAGPAAIAGVRVVTLARGGVSTGRACHLEAVVMTGGAAMTRVLVGTLRARIPTVGAGRDMVVLAGPAAITGVRVVTLARGGVPTGRACHLEAVVMTGPAAITLVLVGTLRARIPTVGAGRDMVVLASPAAIAGVRVVTLARGGVPTGRACHLEAVVMTGPAAITLVLVGTLRARIPTVGAGDRTSVV